MFSPHPLILDPNETYTFRSYFEMRYASADILRDLGCELVRAHLELPRSAWPVERLQQIKEWIEGYLPFIDLSSETARRETLVAPLLLKLAEVVRHRLQIEYPITINQYLKGDLDYYLEAEQGLLIVEAKNADLSRGFVQLATELIAMNLWQAKKQGVESLSNTLVGAVTTGDIWQFGQYDPTTRVVTQDVSLYRLPDDLEVLAELLKGILVKA